MVMEALQNIFPDKMHKNERKFVLERIEGEKPRRSDGTVDTTLFTGENNLWAVFDPMTNMWNLKYTRGTLPGAFAGQRFTQFSRLRSYVSDYYENRGIKIKEIQE